MSLPLRLAVEPYVREVLGQGCFVLPSREEEKVCLIIVEKGLLGFVMDKEYEEEELSSLTGLRSSDLAECRLVKSGDKFKWNLQGSCLGDKVDVNTVLGRVKDVSRRSAMTIVWSIERYYKRQVLEPSIRGFLAILEKQFPRNDLYLFELLQNAVDDGADTIVLKSINNTKSIPGSGDQGGLLFCHNGKSFSPLDVLGLASVGLSTKSNDDMKKKIGFMGVGFKAVYKRFSRVCVYDDIWSFCFNEPKLTPPIEPSHSWVLKPQWLDDENDVKVMKSVSTSLISRYKTTADWCHFLLQNPRGGNHSIKQDLQRLPTTVPVLLGYQSLINKQATSASSTDRTLSRWTLEWEGRTYHVFTSTGNDGSCKNKCACERYSFPVIRQRNPGMPLQRSGKNMIKGNSRQDGAWINSKSDVLFMDRVSLSKSSESTETKRRCWQFITVGFVPSRDAQKTYENHTKKSWAREEFYTNSSSREIQTEEISLFFEIDDATGLPIEAPKSLSTSSKTMGLVHAVLPTKLRLPCSFHLQGSWLLSVDRQDVQSLVENDWNNELLTQFSRLCVVFLQWLAKVCERNIGSSMIYEPSLSVAYGLLPRMEYNPEQENSLSLRMFEQNINLSVLHNAMHHENLVPARVYDKKKSGVAWTGELTFCSASKVLWLPTPFIKNLPISFLNEWWGGLSPFDSVSAGDTAFHPLWRSTLSRPSIGILNGNVKSLANGLITFCEAKCQDFDSKYSNCREAEVVLSLTPTQRKIYLSCCLLATLGECLSIMPPFRHAVDMKDDSLDGDLRSSKLSKNTNKQEKVFQQEPQGLFVDWLPDIRRWPVLPVDTKIHNLSSPRVVTANEVIFLHSDFRTTSIPPKLFEILRSATVSVNDISSERKNESGVIESNRYGGSKWQSKQKKISRKESTPVLYLMDQDVENALIGYSNEELAAIGLDVRVMERAKQCINYLLEGMTPERVIGVDSTCRALLAKWANARHGLVTKNQIGLIMSLFQWAFEQSRPMAVSHLLVNADISKRGSYEKANEYDGGVKLVPSSEAYIDSSLSVSSLGVESQSSSAKSARNSNLPYVIDHYLTHCIEYSNLASATERYIKKYDNFLAKCGAQQGISLVAFKRKLASKETELYLENGSLPKLRSSNTAVDLHLPFNFGILTRKRVEVLDVDLADEWIKILINAKASVTTATSVSVLIASLLSHADTADAVTGQSSPYLQDILAGKAQPEAAGKSSGDKNADHRLPQDMTLCPPPACARMFFLPPGQAGANVVNLSVASWLYRLSNEPWVPARPPGSIEGDPATQVLRPREVALPTLRKQSTSRAIPHGVELMHSQSQSGIETVDDVAMPIAVLNTSTLTMLSSLPPKLQGVMKWGTVLPPPPIEQLEYFAKTISFNTQVDKRQEARFFEYDSWVPCSQEEFNGLLGVWRGICLAERQGRLNAQDKRRVIAACQGQRGDDKPYLIPGAIEGTLYNMKRCIIIPSKGLSNDDDIICTILSKLGFYLSISVASGESDKGFRGVNQSNWILAPYADEVSRVLNLKSSISTTECMSFLKQYFGRLYDANGTGNAPSNIEKAALSACIFRVCKGKASASASASKSSSSISESLRHLIQSVPHMYVYCKGGPGIGPDAFPPRWVPLWLNGVRDRSKWKAGAAVACNLPHVTPVLLDDVKHPPQGCGLYRLSLLRPDHALQPLGMFDHALQDSVINDGLGKYHLQQLVTSDRDILKILKLPMVTDKTYFALGTRVKGDKLTISGVSSRLAVIFLLLNELKPIAQSPCRRDPTHNNRMLLFMPAVFKYESLTLSFKYPTFDINGDHSGFETVNLPAYAIRGAKEAPAATQDNLGALTSTPIQSILLAGTAADYIPELEDIVLTHLYGSQPVLGARSRKALSLLAHIEDDVQFSKYLSRHFSEFLSGSDGVVGHRNNDELDLTYSCSENNDENMPCLKTKLLLAIKSINEKVNEREMRLSKKRKKGSDDVEPQCSSQPCVVNVEATSDTINDTTAIGRGRGVCNKPAWMTSSNDESGSNHPELKPKSDVNNITQLDESTVANLQPKGSGNGRGRGVINTPAWLTQQGDKNTASYMSESNGEVERRRSSISGVEEDCNIGEHLGTEKSDDIIAGDDTTVALGRGRGVCNKPAWMTSEQPVSVQFVENNQNNMTTSSTKNQTFLPASALAESSIPIENTSAINTDSPESGDGRGRGVINSPAWMTMGNSNLATSLSEAVKTTKGTKRPPHEGVEEGEIEEDMSGVEPQKKLRRQSSKGDLVAECLQRSPYSNNVIPSDELADQFLKNFLPDQTDVVSETHERDSSRINAPSLMKPSMETTKTVEFSTENDEYLSFPVMTNILSLLVNRPRAITATGNDRSSRNIKTLTDFTTSVARILTSSEDNIKKMTELCSTEALQQLLDHYNDNLNWKNLDPERAQHIKEKLDSISKYIDMKSNFDDKEISRT